MEQRTIQDHGSTSHVRIRGEQIHKARIPNPTPRTVAWHRLLLLLPCLPRTHSGPRGFVIRPCRHSCICSRTCRDTQCPSLPITSKFLDNPFVILLLLNLFFPLQGLFNVLVFLRPRVNDVRKWVLHAAAAQDPNFTTPPYWKILNEATFKYGNYQRTSSRFVQGRAASSRRFRTSENSMSGIMSTRKHSDRIIAASPPYPAGETTSVEQVIP
jgi:hypothetical protein